MKTLHTRLKKAAQIYKKAEPLTEELQALKEACENDLYTFAKTFWHIVDPSPFRDLWHLRVIAEHLEALYNLEINYLIINTPPRCGKTLLCCAIYSAWILIHDPSFAMLYTSYSEALAITHHLKSRNIIKSPLYKQLWGDVFHILKNVDSGHKYETNRLGFRMISTVAGQGTGWGSDLLSVDDPVNIIDSSSPIMLDRVHFWWTQSMSSRWTTPKRFRRLIIMQRANVRDLCGHIQEDPETDVVVLRLPMEYEADHQCVTIPLKSTNGEKWKDPRTKEGELLCPDLIPKESVEQMKRDLGSASAIAAQLQQRPFLKGGNLFQKDWWQWWVQPNLPPLKFTIQSWDTAFTGSKIQPNGLDSNPTACFSACTTWGIFDYQYRDGTKSTHIILLSVWKKKVQMPELREMAIRLAKNYYDTIPEHPEDGKCPPDMILIEKQASGSSLIDELRRVGVPAIPFNPPRSKMADVTNSDSAKVFRAGVVASYVEAGMVWLPARPPLFTKLYPFAERFREDCAIFPSNESNDVVDSMSQAFMKMRMSGLVPQAVDYVPPPVYDFEKFKKTAAYEV